MPPPKYPSTGNPGVWGTAGKTVKRRPKRTSYDTTDALADTRARARPVDGKAFGVDKGFGVYRGKYGQLTYKGTGKAAPQKPVGDGGQSEIDRLSGEANAAASSHMADISGYYKGLAEILKDVGPGIEAAYGAAAGDIAGFGKGFSDDFRNRVESGANATQNSVEAMTGNYLTDDVEAASRGGYDIGAAADVGYGLGAYLPAKSLREQGAAFGAAGRMLPGSIAQQGLYALTAQARAEAEAAAKASGGSKASASLSKMMGYLVDGSGAPILDKKGRPIPIPKQGLTPYQEAQLEMAQAREDRYISNENFDRWKAQQDISFRNAKEQRQIRNDLRRGKTIDSAASRTAGYIIYKDGSMPRGKNGKPIPVAETSTNSPKAKAQKAFQAAVATAASPTLKGSPIKAERPGFYVARPGFGTLDNVTGQRITQNVNEARTDGYTWGQALRYLMERHGITKQTAIRALKTANWQQPQPKKQGSMPRPNFSTAPLPTIRKYAITVLRMNPAAVNNITDRQKLVDLVKKVESMRKTEEAR